MFKEIRQLMQKQFNKITATGKLFYVDADRDKIWQTYLGAFPEDKKQENTCNCCKSFIRQYGSIVGVQNNKMISLWDFETDDAEYSASINALKEYIHSLPIAGIFLNEFKKCGTEKNADGKRPIIWDHFYIELPADYVKRDIGPLQATALDNKNVLYRSLTEITDNAVDTTLELINQNSIYRGQEFKGIVTEFRRLKEQFKKVKAKEQVNFAWIESSKAGGAVSRIRNTSIGTLLQDLSLGTDLTDAVKSFERVVAPANYKRPTALVTARMIEDAQKTLTDLGLVGALNRRVLSTKDLNVNNTIYVDRPKKKVENIFDEMKQDIVINPRTFAKTEEITIGDFLTNVLPTAKEVKVLVENTHMGNFVSLVGAQDEADPTMFKWGNNFSWSYSGEVTDSIKERVKNAGGKVDGVLRASLSWNNEDDLDLHLIEPQGFTVMYTNRRRLSPSGAILDIDANGADGLVENPVENIYWSDLPKQEGKYSLVVHQFSRRQNTNSGFELEIEFDGETFNFVVPNNGLTGHRHQVVSFNYSKKDGLKIIGETEGRATKYNSKEKWGIKTGQFHKVQAITLSPNFWSEADIGNKHYFFFLENCKADEKIRGFYNEYLKEDLAKNRKVFEVLAGKVKVEPTENELSGIGFSETQKGTVIVEVTGAFKRLLKIKF